MDFLESLKIVLSLIVVENFFYKYYIGVNFFTELHKRDMNKEKIDFLLELPLFNERHKYYFDNYDKLNNFN